MCAWFAGAKFEDVGFAVGSMHLKAAPATVVSLVAIFAAY
jgi:hypothetical protein